MYCAGHQLQRHDSFLLSVIAVPLSCRCGDAEAGTAEEVLPSGPARLISGPAGVRLQAQGRRRRRPRPIEDLEQT